MKVRLTEQQVQNLVSKLDKNVPDNIDIKKIAPDILKYFELFGDLNKDAIPSLTQKPIQKIKNVVTKKNIPNDNIDDDDDEPMHPLGNPVPIVSQFGPRKSKIGSSNHKGIDLATPSGSKVYAPLSGIILSAKDTTPNPCGGFVKIDHNNMITKFCHLRKIIVREGENVKKGQIIGYSGGGKNDPMRGTTSGPHLHYETLNKNGIAMNPLTAQPNLAHYA